MEDIAIMKKLVSDFVDTFMGTPNTYPLTKASADDIVDYFRALLMEDYRPEEIVPMRPAHATAWASTTIERALMCRLIDQYMKKHTLEGPLTNTHLVRLAIYIVELLQSFEVRAMYGEKTFVEIDVEYDDLYGYYVRTLARRYFDAWYHRNVFGDPLTEDHVRDLLGDFQDLIWGAYGDDAIKVD